ncbi:MAG: MotA/TolQ/ExbB proton channel family protein [Candidatus Eisenbacteria bacterium]|nr:MotA/TolQ/ExbB proton channel family protein [Candidatus Eisenbacteria bacterium]
MVQWRSFKTLLLVALLCVMATIAGDLAQAQEGTGSGTKAGQQFQSDLPTSVPDEPVPPPVRPEGSFFSVAAQFGGTIFWVLVVMAIVTLLVSLERFFSLMKGRVDVSRFMGDLVRALNDKGPNAAMEIASRNKGPIGQIVMYGLQRISRGAEGVEKAVETATLAQIVGMRRGLGILSFVGQSAPLLGFIGTVMGMLHAFDAAVGTGRVNASQAVGGISEAVITTTAGIAVAIVANIFINLITARIDRLTVQMEEAGDELVDAVHAAGPRLKERTA